MEINGLSRDPGKSRDLPRQIPNPGTAQKSGFSGTLIGTCLDLATLSMPTIHKPMPKYLVQDLVKEGGKIGVDKILH